MSREGQLLSRIQEADAHRDRAVQEIERRITEAVLAERERCARIAEERGSLLASASAGGLIARAIRGNA